MNDENQFSLDDQELVSVLDEINLWSAPFALKLLDTIKYRKNIVALDIGFGTGFPLIELAMRMGNTSAIYGIDPWEAAAKRALFKIQAFGISNITLISGKAENMPFGTDYFDLIVSNNGINNADDMQAVFAECFRTMKPGAQFVFTVNLHFTMIEFYRIFAKALAVNGLNEESAKMRQHINSKRKSVAEILKKLNSAGLTVNNIFHDCFRFRYSDGTSFLNHYFIKLAFMPEWKKIIPEGERDFIFSLLESELNSISDMYGSLSLSVPFAVFDCEKNI